MFVCGDDVEATTITTGLVAEHGFEVVDAGDVKCLICRIHQNIRRKSDDN
jgi:hypothetical protein